MIGFWSMGFDNVWRSASTSLGTITQRLIDPITNAIRDVIERVKLPGSRTVDWRSQDRTRGTNRDRLRQVLNVVLAIGQVATTILTFATGTEAEITTRSTTEPPILPAPYTFFVIWSVIYASTIAYSVYQALPAQRTNELFRRIGWWTAAAFAGTSLWLLAAAQGQAWLAAAIFFGILGALVIAFVRLIRVGAPRSNAERYLVVLPIAIYTAWSTIGTIANVASVLNKSGYTELLLGPQAWAIVMLLAAGAIGSLVTRVSRGNLPYALTIVWALVGVVVANVSDDLSVALVAGVVIAIVATVLIRTRIRSRRA
jgi:translocator protein